MGLQADWPSQEESRNINANIDEEIENEVSLPDVNDADSPLNLEISLKSMYPSFRGRRLDLPNFSQNHIEEITFLVANKKNENFKLLIDIIELI